MESGKCLKMRNNKKLKADDKAFKNMLESLKDIGQRSQDDHKGVSLQSDNSIQMLSLLKGGKAALQ